MKALLENLKMVLITPFKKIATNFERITNVKTISSKITQGVNKYLQKYISRKPKSLKEYVSLGQYYISKKLVCLLILLIIALSTFIVTFVIPKIISMITEPTFVINSQEMFEYKGKRAKILNKEGGVIIYEGEMEDGRITGKGKLYDEDGDPIYVGEFLLEEFCGNGELYYKNGNLKYKGTFEHNLYNGEGKLYY